MKQPVVVVIFAHQATLSEFETIALRQCHEILGHHPLRLMCPRGMDTAAYLRLAPTLHVDEIAPHHLGSIASYNRLKIDPKLYDHFNDYEYLLTYELDAFVFRDELLEWCARGWDYIGAPWFEGYHEATDSSKVLKVGNSGFSLRKIQSCRRALRAQLMVKPLSKVWNEWLEFGRLSPGSLMLLFHQAILKNMFRNPSEWFIGPEDYFWSFVTEERYPWFRVADYPSARRFSFELLPKRLHLENDGNLPFGCHKWHESCLEFWKPFIEEYGHVLPARRF
jgi:hypothetical protein